MIPTSLLGNLETNNIKIGVWRFFVAPHDTYIDETTRFDTICPPAPFLDLGSSGQDSQFSATKQLYKYKNGMPETIKLIKVTAIDFTMTVNLDEFSAANLSRAVYNTTYGIKKFSGTPAIAAAAAIPSGNVVQLSSSTNFVEGMYVALSASPSGLVTTGDEYRIVEISGNYLILNRDVSTVFSSAPYVGQIESWKISTATSRAINVSIVGCWDSSGDDIQLVVAIPRAVIDGSFNTGATPVSTHQKISMSVSGKAFYDIDLGDNVVANIFRFSA